MAQSVYSNIMVEICSYSELVLHCASLFVEAKKLNDIYTNKQIKKTHTHTYTLNRKSCRQILVWNECFVPPFWLPLCGARTCGHTNRDPRVAATVFLEWPRRTHIHTHSRMVAFYHMENGCTIRSAKLICVI